MPPVHRHTCRIIVVLHEYRFQLCVGVKAVQGQFLAHAGLLPAAYGHVHRPHRDGAIDAHSTRLEGFGDSDSAVEVGSVNRSYQEYQT